MITIETTRAGLCRSERWRRCALIGGIAIGAILLRAVDPAKAHAWLPISCGAVTGLPCIFCGTTRALHALLNGDFARALYFNWIAFAVAAVALFGIAISLCELITRERLVRVTGVRVTPRVICFALIGLLAVWILQVWLAVSQHKHELLNPRGPLYAVFVGRSK